MAALTCGSSVTGANDAAGSTDNIDLYNCVGWDETGPEYTYSFIPAADAHIVFELSNMTEDLDAFLIEENGAGCDGNECIAYAHYTGWADVTTGTTYYLAVDGFEGAVSAYDLNLTCLPACAGNGHDEDGDGLDDNCDNCPTYYNLVPENSDSDDIGDACEWKGHTGTLSTSSRRSSP